MNNLRKALLKADEFIQREYNIKRIGIDFKIKTSSGKFNEFHTPGFNKDISYSHLLNKNIQFKADQFPELKFIHGQLISEDHNSISIKLGCSLSGKVVTWVPGQKVIFYKSVIKNVKRKL